MNPGLVYELYELLSRFVRTKTHQMTRSPNEGAVRLVTQTVASRASSRASLRIKDCVDILARTV